MNFLKQLAAITLPTLVVLFLLLEVVFRFVIPASNPPLGYFDDDTLMMRLDPASPEGLNTIGAFARQPAKWRVNSYGWNSPIDYAEARTPGKKRIAVIGDSYIEALQVDIDQSYPALLHQRLAGSAEVFAFGRSGASLSQYLHMSRYAAKTFDPDVLVLNEGAGWHPAHERAERIAACLDADHRIAHTGSGFDLAFFSRLPILGLVEPDADSLFHGLAWIEVRTPDEGDLVVAGLHLGSGVDPEALFSWIRYLLLCLWPLSVFASARWMGFSPWIAAVAAALAPLLATEGLFGLEFGSYVWRGSGLFTQSLAMHLFALTLGCGARALRSGRHLVAAVTRDSDSSRNSAREPITRRIQGRG